MNSYYKNVKYKLQDSACNACNDLTILCLNINDIAIITVKNVDYCCIIKVGKSEAINKFCS